MQELELCRMTGNPQTLIMMTSEIPEQLLQRTAKLGELPLQKANHSELLILNLELDKFQTHSSDPQRLSTSLTVHHVDATMTISRRQMKASILGALNILEPSSLASMMKMVAYYEFKKPPYIWVFNKGLLY